ncbi:hypothetical protein ACFLSJ_04010 [Verrucomicrobiota bacterium]
MAHSTLHFSVGMIAGSAVAFHVLARAWRAGRGLARAFAAWLLVSYALGVFAVVPGLLRRLGVPDSICDGWWMNVFLFYPLINRVKPGAMTSGPIALAACFGAQYVILLAALRKLMRAKRDQDPSRPQSAADSP